MLAMKEADGVLQSDVDACYVRISPQVFEPTLRVQGAWSPQEQHMAPLAGLIAHELERFQPNKRLQLAKIGYEILGFIPLATTTVEIELARPGRTIEQLAFTASVGGRAVVRGTAWRLLRTDTSGVSGTPDVSMPGPDELAEFSLADRWSGGYIDSIELRGDFGDPGRNHAWLRCTVPLVAGERSGPVAGFVRLVDTANGIATRVEPDKWMFPNVDLVIDLWREPDPQWVGLDTSVSFGPSGVGLTSSVLHDLAGPLGRAEQVLTVRRLPAQ